MEGEKMIDILRRVRHDLGNHLQVISGYLDLGRLEEIREYIDTIAEEMKYEKWLFNHLEPEAALYFYYQMLSAQDLGAIIRYTDIKIEDFKIIEKANEPYATIAEIHDKFGGAKDLNLKVLFGQEGKAIKMLIQTDHGEELVRILKE